MCCFVLGRVCSLALSGMGRPLPLAAARCAALCGMCWPLLPQLLSAAASPAGASATGAARWYMAAAMGLGALCWRWCVCRAVHRALRGTVFVLVWPLRFAADYAVHPFKQRRAGPDQKDSASPGGTTHKIHARKAEKSRKMCCKTEHAIYYIIKLSLSMPALSQPSCAGRRYNGLHTTAF